MAIEPIAESFGARKEIMAIADHYVGLPYKLSKNSVLAVDVNGRKIVRAGTIFPSNDAAALGVVLHDYDVTDSDKNATIILHGFVKIAALPEAPSEEAEAVLPAICFMPFRRTALDIKTNFIYKTDGDSRVYVRVNGTRFASSNPTITFPVNTTGLTLTLEGVSANLKVATFTVSGTLQEGSLSAAVAGTQVVNGKSGSASIHLRLKQDQATIPAPNACVTTFSAEEDAETPVTGYTLEVKKGDAVIAPTATGGSTYNLDTGAYTYTISKTGYKTQTDVALNITNADITKGTKAVVVTLENAG